MYETEGVLGVHCVLTAYDVLHRCMYYIKQA
jgi:hypothetical protein